MTPRLRASLLGLASRVDFTGDDDYVFTRDGLGRPAAQRPLRDAFKTAARAAGLKLIPMYNARHSFGTSLARDGVDVRTIQALMRHDRLTTTSGRARFSDCLSKRRELTADADGFLGKFTMLVLVDDQLVS
jgi:integrase